MMIDLSDDDLTLVLRALDQYTAYLVATQRNDNAYYLAPFSNPGVLAC